MASVKGILVEIGGDTSGLQKSLSKVNSSTASLSKELRGINTLLKLDPKNTELLSQKQTVLNKNITETEEKLKKLQTAKEDADTKMANGTKISEEGYRNLQREIINTENKLKEMKAEASNWTTAGTKLTEYGTKIDTIGDKAGKLGTTLTTTVTAGVTAVSGLAIATFNEVDEGSDIVIKKTGATGDAAIELKEVYKNVAGEVSGSFEDVGNAVGEINTRFGFVGDVLDEASQKFLKFARVNDTDVNTAVQKVSRYMGDAGIESSKYGEVLDQLTSVAQASGISIDSLTEMLTKYGAPMRALGLDTKESIAIFAGWEKAGVNTEIAFSGMKKAIGTWGKEGKNSTEEFKKTIEEIKNAPDQMTATTKAIEVFGQKAGPDLADAIQGGRFEYGEFLNILEKSDGVLNETYSNITDETDNAKIKMKELKVEFAEIGAEILQTAEPAIEDIVGTIKDLISKFNSLDPELKKNILKYTALAAAAGPVIKTGGTLISTVGKTVTSVGSLCTAIGKVRNGVPVANNAVGLFAKGLVGLASPAGIAIAAVTLLAGVLIAETIKAEEKTKEAFSNMGEGASGFINGLNSAESHLSSFNSTLFASSEEQQKLKEDMDAIQTGITSICKTASDERRDYTQEEITQLDEYFAKLRELKNREIEIQQSIGTAITQQATTNSQTFQGSLEEYKVQSQQWIKTATEQKDATVKLIQDGTTQEVALLNQKYGDKANMNNEAYANEYNNIVAQQQQKIDLANQEVAKVSETYSNGYLQRATQEDSFYQILEEAKNKQATLEQSHTDKVKAIKDGELWYVTDIAGSIRSENETYAFHQKETWDEMYKNMSKSQAKQLGVWLVQLSQTELYGGNISEENQNMVNTILDSYNDMPDKTKEAMKEAMSPMLTEMEDKEPSLFAKATGIADGILSRLRKSFDIHSPSRKVRKIFDYVMQGAEIEMDAGTKKLYKQTDEMSKGLLEKFGKISTSINTGSINSKILDNTRTICTTPQIVFNVQEMDEAKLEQCFNYINKKFGTRY